MTRSSEAVFELDLRREIRRVGMHWRLVLGAGVTAGVFGLLIALAFPRVYDAEVEIKIARSFEELIETPSEVSDFLLSAAFRSQLAATSAWAGASLAAVEPLQSSVRIRVVAPSPAQAATAVELVADAVIKRHRPLYERAVREYDEYVALLEKRIQAMAADTDQRERLIREHKTGANETVASMLVLIQDRNAEIIKASRELRDLRVRRETRTKPSYVVVAPMAVPAVLWPRPVVFVAVAFLLGLGLAASAVLLTVPLETSDASRQSAPVEV